MAGGVGPGFVDRGEAREPFEVATSGENGVGAAGLKLGTTGGLDAATIDAVAAAGGTVLDARNKARAAEDELTQLTREAALLKAKDDICTILKKYDLPCTDPPQ